MNLFRNIPGYLALVPAFALCLLFLSLTVNAQGGKTAEPVAAKGDKILEVDNLLCENRIDPVGLDNPMPKFTWQLVSSKRNTIQKAYQIRVTIAESKKTVWDSKKISSDSSVKVAYKGQLLLSSTKYYWQVRVWDNQGRSSQWSKPGFWVTGLFNTADWTSKWISPGFTETAGRPSPLFRKTFISEKKIRSAYAFITAHGLYEAQINGHRVSDAYLTPGWTSYNKRLQYQVYDVTGMINKGNNAIGITLGSGWYRGIIGFTNNKDVYGKDISLLFLMHIVYEDGSLAVIESDGSWKIIYR